MASQMDLTETLGTTSPHLQTISTWLTPTHSLRLRTRVSFSKNSSIIPLIHYINHFSSVLPNTWDPSILTLNTLCCNWAIFNRLSYIRLYPSWRYTVMFILVSSTKATDMNGWATNISRFTRLWSNVWSHLFYYPIMTLGLHLADHKHYMHLDTRVPSGYGHSWRMLTWFIKLAFFITAPAHTPETGAQMHSLRSILSCWPPELHLPVSISYIQLLLCTFSH